MDRIDRRDALRLLGLGGAAAATPALAQALVDLRLAGGGGARPTTAAFPEKGAMILQRTRAPLLETPIDAFDGQVFTPNDRFFVRWHYADFPTAIDGARHRLAIGGAVQRRLSLSLADLTAMPRFEIAAVNQCSGNSRGHFSPRVPGAQWGNGAMGNALWAGVRLRDVLDRAGVMAGATGVRFAGLDRPPPGAPWFAKSIGIDHARDGEVMLAFAMNGERLPLLNGYPLRLVVPGWYSTYWIKALDRIEVIDTPDTGYWMEKAYRIPTAPRATVVPGAKDFPTEPINAMNPRAFVTNLTEWEAIRARSPFFVRGLAMGGAAGVARVDVSMNHGRSWHPATLGADHGKYGFRLWEMTAAGVAPGSYRIAVRCTNTAGETQTDAAVWNPGGFMNNRIESVGVRAA
ncbi:MAG: molybdopterin-dependent oxidoreductase [Pseudomonadota bacterium]